MLSPLFPPVVDEGFPSGWQSPATGWHNGKNHCRKMKEETQCSVFILLFSPVMQSYPGVCLPMETLTGRVWVAVPSVPMPGAEDLGMGAPGASIQP